MSLLKKGLLIIFVPLVLQALLLATLFKQQRQQTHAQEMAVHTKDVLQALDGILESLLILQTDLRGELLGLDPESDRSGQTEDLLPAQIARVERLVADNGQQTARARRLATLVQERVRWAGIVRAQIRSGARAQAIEEFQRGHGADLMRQIRAELGRIRGEEEILDRQRLQALRDSTRVFQIVLLSGLVLDVVVAGTAMWLVATSVGRRVRALSENVNRMKLGDPLLPPMRVADELGELDRSFHAMADALRQSLLKEREFQRTIERHNAELTRANHELKQKNQENEMFVYSVSHDLRSPLVNLQGFSKELGLVRNDLCDLFAQPVDEAARERGLRLVKRDISEPIAFIQTAVTRLSSIIDALLRLSRAGRVEYQPVHLELTPVIQRVVDALRGSLASRQARVTIHELPPVWGDRTAVEQIFANLLVNAVNYLDPSRPGLIEVGATEIETLGTTYHVRDNGLGIAAAHLPKLFAAFQRLHEKVAPGEGVGLALVRRVVERHGGKIWAESEEGIGTTFYVHLPPEAESPLQPTPRKESLNQHLQRHPTRIAAAHATADP